MKRVDSFGAIDCQLVKPAEAAKIIHEAIAETGASAFSTSKAEPVVLYVAALGSYLCGEQLWEGETWEQCCGAYLACIDATQGAALAAAFRNKCKKALAYGGKLLLHNTRLFLKCGRRYGICGKNGVGKTTLMRNVNVGKIEGMDPDLVSVFVESHADEDPDDVLCVREWTTKRPELVERGAADEGPAVELLKSVGFSDELLATPVGNLSGGWRMKLSLVVAALMDADILLLDEPTNHLESVEWLQRHLCSCRACCMIVSHDTGFLDATCTDIIHYEERKLVRYRGTSPLVAKAIVKLENATFTWPAATPRRSPTARASSRRLARCVLGENGAGKSTLIKLLVGENGPDNGECLWRHHNLRIAYVAQHSFHHVEMHLDKSPCEYLQWRFGKFIDQETLNTALEELKRKQAQATFASPSGTSPLASSPSRAAADKELKVGKKKRESKSKAVEKTTGSVNEEIKIVVPKDFWGKSLSKKDARSYEKAAKKRDVALMRKILQVPKGKTMPGAPELGDGTGK
ncbi:ATPase [Aureococcus anophagefferens]|nr:ATPase [Aureococcus anophagefferens]